ncbi:MAG: hypoxanthine phosphoribosyltransferase [Saprospiraceae bacterium]|nr:hypoxanthine phosphoribosyltransferase [Saprospiraceae bacterium]
MIIEGDQMVRIGRRTFEQLISRDAIDHRIGEMADDLTEQYRDLEPVFIVVLNGAFIFAADLLRACALDCDIQFVKLSSYQGTSSTGVIQQILGVQIPLRGRHVIVVEDIVDTGRTLKYFAELLRKEHPASIEFVTLLSKPDCHETRFESPYIGFEIPNAFVIGYGLDLDGRARNLDSIYQLRDESP